jgi:hypothetical protein
MLIETDKIRNGHRIQKKGKVKDGRRNKRQKERVIYKSRSTKSNFS